MAESPSTIRVTHDELAMSIMRTGQKLIELGMQLQQGFDVEVTYEKSPRLDVSAEPSDMRESSYSDGGES